MRQIQFHRDVIAARFAGFGDEFLNAVLVNGEGFFHGIGVFAAAGGDFQFRFAGFVIVRAPNPRALRHWREPFNVRRQAPVSPLDEKTAAVC